MLPSEAKNARKLCQERLHELAEIATVLLENPRLNPWQGAAPTCSKSQVISKLQGSGMNKLDHLIPKIKRHNLNEIRQARRALC